MMRWRNPIRRQSLRVAASAAPDVGVGERKRVVVLGGTGRVGSATAAALIRLAGKDGAMASGIDVVLAARDGSKAPDAMAQWPELAGASFERCDVRDRASLERVLGGGGGTDLVIHAAGPFQGAEPDVLDAAVSLGVPYIDVCDDAEHTLRAKRDVDARAASQGVPAVVSCGVYPGLSNVVAAFMCDRSASGGSPYPDNEATHLRFSYFTAGSGGVGPTILATSILLLGEPATVVADGEESTADAFSRRMVVEFGAKVGAREVFALNLPETLTAHRTLGVPNVTASFGTAPGVWNGAMQAMARVVPAGILRNRSFANAAAGALMPLVKGVDALVGGRTAMRIDAKYDNGKVSSSLFVHEDTAMAAGASTAAFAAAVMGGGVAPGVHFPEEQGVVGDYAAFFALAGEGASEIALAKAPWTFDAQAKHIGMGLYF